ncbi:hypothetical protein B7C42_05234 [Nocardia cerradoensis]|uniref:Uncharacterized protein n=1 Tax=Nocardia cerradoensis TaxID=85688 RepID=A0A231H0U0_9NOCA|nr:hypothetical protein B7C42_05234 [Nocardia cerradoensis]
MSNSSSRLSSGRASSCARNARSTRWLVGRGSPTGIRPVRCLPSAAPSSITASGLPPASSSTRRRRWTSSVRGASRRVCVSNCSDSSGRSGPSSSRWIPSSRGVWPPILARSAHNSSNGALLNRRATKASTSSDDWSSHCASSTRSSNRPVVADSSSNPSTASETSRRSGGGPSSRPNAVIRAARCRRGSASAWASTGWINSWIPAKPTSV